MLDRDKIIVKGSFLQPNNEENDYITGTEHSKILEWTGGSTCLKFVRNTGNYLSFEIWADNREEYLSADKENAFPAWMICTRHPNAMKLLELWDAPARVLWDAILEAVEWPSIIHELMPLVRWE